MHKKVNPKKRITKKLIKISLLIAGVVITSIFTKAIYNFKDVEFVD